MTHCIAQNVGVDISKDWLDVHLHPDGACRRFGNDPAGHKALFKWLGGWTVERIAYEATGAYCRAFAIGCQVWGGLVKDPTGGATHYHRHDIEPVWAKAMKPTALIGAHMFYA